LFILLFQIILISIEKQRRRPPFFKIWLETPAIFKIVFGCRMGGGRAARARLAGRKYTKCFRLVLKS
jgi:hypothetical protein